MSYSNRLWKKKFDKDLSENKAKEEQSKTEANNMRLKAMKSLNENKKRRTEEQDENQFGNKNRGPEALEYVRENMDEEKHLREQKLEIKRKDKERDQQKQKLAEDNTKTEARIDKNEKCNNFAFFRLNREGKNYQEQPKGTAFLSKLLFLFQTCRWCFASNPLLSMSQSGTTLTTKSTCSHWNEAFTWTSKAFMLGKLPCRKFVAKLHHSVFWGIHGGARPPLICAHNAWVCFFKMAVNSHAKTSGFHHVGFHIFLRDFLVICWGSGASN